MKKILLILSLAICELANAQNTCTPVITNGLVGYYPFCSNANDASGNGNNGTVNGATLTNDRFGNANSAYSFNGSSDYIGVPSGNTTSLNVTGDFTLSFWLKTSQGANHIISFGDVINTNSGGYLAGLNDGSAPFGYLGFSTQGIWHVSTITLNDNNWHNLVVTLKADTIRLYIDNTLNVQTTGVLPPLSWSGSRTIGSRNDFFNGWYQGILDDISVYNRALSAAEINSVFNSICTADITTGLIGNYPFNGNANDISGNNNNGVVFGATLTTDRFGNANNAYSFNGISDYINCGISSATIFANGVSFCAWIYPTVYELSSVVDRMQNTGSGFRINTRDVSNGSTIWAQADNYTVGGLAANSTTQYNPNQWLFITGTWSTNDSVKIYINGNWEGSTTVTYDMSSPYPILIGIGQRYLNFEPFQGKIDDVKIYNRALSSCDVDSLYDNTSSTGINENLLPNNFALYPNPTNGILFINGIVNERIVVYNSLGEMVKELQAENKIDLSDCADGIYFLQVKNRDGKIVFATKVLKE
jgi:hypothetical protein